MKDTNNTCRTCIHRQRWRADYEVKFTQYCEIHKSNRTRNGLLKIKVTNPACYFYEDIMNTEDDSGKTTAKSIKNETDVD